MPGPYRKKRRVVGPSKNEERVERSRREEALTRSSNSLGARFPDVRSLVVKLSFFGAQGQSFGDETRKFGPEDPCLFAVPCPGRCGVGSFDLAAKIAAVLTNHEPASQGSGVCQEPLAAGSAAKCECRLDCAIEVVYTQA